MPEFYQGLPHMLLPCTISTCTLYLIAATYIHLQALLKLPNLMMLYLHGNNIFKLSEVDKLADLPKLKTLSLHGNPIETSTGYRNHVICRLPQLQTFDFSGVTKGERQTALVWNTSKRTPKQVQH